MESVDSNPDDPGEEIGFDVVGKWKRYGVSGADAQRAIKCFQRAVMLCPDDEESGGSPWLSPASRKSEMIFTSRQGAAWLNCPICPMELDFQSSMDFLTFAGSVVDCDSCISLFHASIELLNMQYISWLVRLWTRLLH
ncbi:hypothetical protein MLD38_012795 [Melastoma candidum]|uniref:Uncharacterized protein n=1 Tax=Melastoma candidum TaxID=119954 RepID=A0ACB9R7R0_9MYRT|nr:hypothetical protein MLD38_012795 [Melastoma candidum]